MQETLDRFTEYRDPSPYLNSDCSVEEALSFMTSKGMYYLPIVDDLQLKGIVAYESVVRAIQNFNLPVDKLHLSHVLIVIRKFELNAKFKYVLSAMEEHGAVGLVEYNKSENVDFYIDLLTNRDTALFLYTSHVDLMSVERIELMIRGMIKYSCSSEMGGLDETALNEAVKKVSPKGKDFDQLNLSQYIHILLDATKWGFFQPYFKLKSNETRHLLEEIGKIRNRLLHYRGEISADQRKKLEFCLDWLTDINMKMGKSLKT